jgi:hypothetical protein
MAAPVVKRFSDFGLNFSVRFLKRHSSTLRHILLGDEVPIIDEASLAFAMATAASSGDAYGGRSIGRAAQYVRMSTEHQKYSTENQAEIIARYAAQRGFEIVRTYEDAGKSGLRLDGRDALQKLIADVRTGAADFTTILV